MLDVEVANYYFCISKVEPIFHAETLVVSLNVSSPIKRYTLLLIRLAKAHVIATEYHTGNPPIKFLHNLRWKFLCLLESLSYVLSSLHV